MTRSCPEWIAKHDDQAIPPRVKLRIFERENGICHLTGAKILPGDQWDADHKVPLILGGEHRESNLFPALRADHRKKSAAEMAVKSKVAKVRKKHLSITRPAGKLKSAPFPSTEKAESRSSKAILPRRSLYAEASNAAPTPAALETLTRERDEAREALKLVRDGYGPNHLSRYAYVIADDALAGGKQE